MSYAAKLERNGVRIVNTSNGATKRLISGAFTQAVVQGNEAHCTQQDGRVKVVNISNGATIRLI